MSISLVIIVKNEMRWLPEFLNSVEGSFSEIVMIDSGSTDGSLEFARSRGVRVFPFTWCDDFSAARNFGISKATGDWIFTMDPDEKISKSGLQILPELSKNASVDAYSAVVRNYIEDSSTADAHRCTGEFKEFEKDYRLYTEAKRIRFFRRSPEIYYVGRIHELVESTVKGSVEFLPFVVHHYGLLESEIQAKQKSKLYGDLIDAQLLETPDSAKVQLEALFHFAKQSNWRKVIENFEKLALQKLTHPLVISQAAWAYHQLGFDDEAIFISETGMKQFPNDTDVIFNLATVYFSKKEFDRAEPLYLKVHDLNPTSLEALRNASFCNICKGNYERAYELCRRVLENDSHHLDARIDEILLLGILGRKTKAREKAHLLSLGGCAHPRFLKTLSKLA